MTPEEFVKKVRDIKHSAEPGTSKTDIEACCCVELGMCLATFRMAYEAAMRACRYSDQFYVYQANPRDTLAAMSELRKHYGLPQDTKQDEEHIATKVLSGENPML